MARIAIPLELRSLIRELDRACWWTSHFVWTKDYTVLEGLTSIGRATIEALHINRPQMVRLRAL